MVRERELVAAATSASGTLVSTAEAATTWQNVDPDYRRGFIAGVQFGLEQMIRTGEREELPDEVLRPYRVGHQQVTETLEAFIAVGYRSIDREKTPTAATVEAE